MGVDVQPYTLVKLPSSREAYVKVMVASLEAASTVLPSPLCTDPMLPLVATLVIFKTILDSPFVMTKDKGKVAEAGNYLAKWLATVDVLVDKSMNTMVALCDAILLGEGGR